ncbi:MAG: ribosomal-protein-alanine N-acetyltransferase [Planctomycetaceae bacterium]|jgi:ribosomal-protein-alanine N-acetyltransferase
MSQAQTIPVNDELWMSPLVAEDREACVELLNNREIERRMLSVPHPYGESEFDSFLAIAAAAREEHGCDVHFAIRHQGEGMIGGCGFEGIKPGHRVEIGYWLGQPYWGRGFMTPVVAAACKFVIDTWGVKRIEAYVFDGNNRSARVLEKNGFCFEGLLRKLDRKGDVFIDTRVFAKIVD